MENIVEIQIKENASQSRNDFKPFATGEGANVLEQSEYERSGFLKEGFKKGMARSSEINKAIRQGSSIAAAVARFTASKTGEDMLDNGDIDTLSQHIETAISSVSSLLISEADGTADALTATFVPTIKQLKNGLLVHIRAKTINATPTPTFKADETGAKAIVKGNNLPLAMGDIAGAGHWLELQYDEALDKWILQNPAKGITPQSGVPVGTIEYFARETLPQGYLFATGQDVGRETYPDLFAAIGTTYGEGDGQTTFNLPALNRELGEIVPFASLHMPSEYLMCDGRAISRRDYAELFAVIGTNYGEGDGTSTFNLPDFIDRFTQGSTTPGLKVEAGLPNIVGEVQGTRSSVAVPSGAFSGSENGTDGAQSASTGSVKFYAKNIFDASCSSPLYGASDTVQPPALTVCYGIRAKNTLHAAIKAFDTSINPGLIDITELANDIRKAKTPLGTVAWFAMTAPPVGYLIANGAAVGRETYPELFAAIGTTYGEGDGKTTFNLPDLIDRFAQGSHTPGQKVEAGVPNITGTLSRVAFIGGSVSGMVKPLTSIAGGYGGSGGGLFGNLYLDASMSSPVYGASDTVQPPALTLLPCIKAFDAATNPGLIDVTELANEVVSHKHVTETFNDGTSWYRKWSDGWLEQGGTIQASISTSLLSLPVAFKNTNYYVVGCMQYNANIDARGVITCSPASATTMYFDARTVSPTSSLQSLRCTFYACGQGE